MDRVIPFVRKAAGEKQPFFAVVWFHTPHSPVVAGPRYREIYRDLDENRQHYYGCITAMDEQVGRLRAELEKLGVAENTMLWFCSDNGPARQGSPRHVGSTKGLSGYKLSVSEGGIRVPGLLVWPGGVDAPRTVAAPCVTSDYFPTILEATGAELPADRVYDGISLLPLVRGELEERGSPIGFLNKEGNESVWMGDRYKLVVKGAKKSLFDIPADPGETRNLAGALPGVRGSMESELSAWKAGVMAELAAVPE
jgi:arylsulfatase A-like enzyme